jgi:hypothetical protein
MGDAPYAPLALMKSIEFLVSDALEELYPIKEPQVAVPPVKQEKFPIFMEHKSASNAILDISLRTQFLARNAHQELFMWIQHIVSLKMNVKQANSSTKLLENANLVSLAPLLMAQPHYPSANPVQQELLLLIKTANNALLVKLVASLWTPLSAIHVLLEPFLSKELLNVPLAKQEK